MLVLYQVLNYQVPINQSINHLYFMLRDPYKQQERNKVNGYIDRNNTGRETRQSPHKRQYQQDC